MKYSFADAAAEDRHVTQYFEIGCNRGIYHEGWTAVTRHFLPWPDPNDHPPSVYDDVWELYGPDDWTQAHDLASENPDMLRKLQDRFLIEASKYNVLPLDPRQRERFDPRTAGRPDLLAGRSSMTLYPGMQRLNENTVPNVKNTTHTVTARITLNGEVGQGAIIAQGGSFGGWCLYMNDGVPSYGYNWVGLEAWTIRADKAIGAGDHTVAARFDYDGDGAGKGAKITLSCDGEEIGSGRIEKSVPAVFSFDDFLDIGHDSGEPVVEDYAVHGGAFNGVIHDVTIDLAPDSHHDPELVMRAKYRKQ
jgi:hypothetical protein